MVTPLQFELIDKPAGVPGDRENGFVQLVSRLRGQPLFAVNDLDREVSGTVMVTSTLQSCTQLRQHAADGRLRTVFRFVTDQPTPPQPKQAGPYPLNHCDTAAFHSTSHSLWEAETVGLPDAEQLRVQVAAAGLPVLGDTAHGGSPFPRLMLHCLEMRVDDDTTEGDITPPFRVPPPFVFDCPAQFDKTDLITWLVCIERRQRAFSIQADDTLRLIHTDGGHLRCDRLGPVCWFYWYGDDPPQDSQLEDVATVAAVAGADHWRLQWMFDRGNDPQQKRLWGDGSGESEWVGSENDVRYLFREGQGLSPGLFLDQRRNRQWVKEQADGKRVLNLFSYTGGFGICAAAGGAGEIVNVDTNRNTQDWARQNFLLNGFPIDDTEFPITDARLFVHGCARRDREFDLIVCDPPSFARCRDGVFQLNRHLPQLLGDLLAITAPEGSIVVSTNYEKWNFREFYSRVVNTVGRRVHVLPMPEQEWDFELPGGQVEPILKSLCLRVE